MVDKFESNAKGLTSPADEHYLIVPDDDNDLPVIPRAIRCEVAGVIVIRDRLGVELPYTMGVGDREDFRGVRVMATGTTGTFYGWS